MIKDGGVFDENVTINVAEQTVTFHVPLREGADEANVVHDFRKVLNFAFSHCKLKRSVSAPKCQFTPEGQSLIQPFLEPLEHNLGQKSSIKRLFQPTVGPISALGPNQP